MKNKLLYWSPRILSILFVAFLCLFSFDDIGKFNGWRAVLAVAIHLIIPAIVLLGAIIAWKRNLFGAVIFFFFAICYVYTIGLGRPFSWYLSISLPAIIISVLFFINFIKKKNNSKPE